MSNHITGSNKRPKTQGGGNNFSAGNAGRNHLFQLLKMFQLWGQILCGKWEEVEVTNFALCLLLAGGNGLSLLSSSSTQRQHLFWNFPVLLWAMLFSVETYPTWETFVSHLPRYRNLGYLLSATVGEPSQFDHGRKLSKVVENTSLTPASNKVTGSAK